MERIKDLLMVESHKSKVTIDPSIRRNSLKSQLPGENQYNEKSISILYVVFLNITLFHMKRTERVTVTGVQSKISNKHQKNIKT